MENVYYRRGDEPDVEVLVDGVWYPGELRAWVQRDGAWWAEVSWSVEGRTFLGGVCEARVRPDTVDRSYGRQA